MCSKYKKRNFMLPVKTRIPPNNSLLFCFLPRWNIYESSAMESQEKLSDLVYSPQLPVSVGLNSVNFRINFF